MRGQEYARTGTLLWSCGWTWLQPLRWQKSTGWLTSFGTPSSARFRTRICRSVRERRGRGEISPIRHRIWRRCGAGDYGETISSDYDFHSSMDLGFVGVDRFLFGMEMDQERGSRLSAPRGKTDSAVRGCPAGRAFSLD